METKLIFPLIIEGKYKSRLIDYVCLMMYKIPKENHPTKKTVIHFWEKPLDDRFHPNDYLKIEEQELTLQWLFSTCCGMKEIATIVKTVIFTPEEIKLQTVIQDFRKKNCLYQTKKSSCKSRHYFIGIGKYIVDDVTYEGIHIVSYPAQDPEQEKITSDLADIPDPIYTKYLDWCKKNPDANQDQINQQKNELSELYISEFYRLLMKAQSFIKKQEKIIKKEKRTAKEEI